MWNSWSHNRSSYVALHLPQTLNNAVMLATQAGPGVRCWLRQSVHATTDDGPSAGHQEDPPLCCGHLRLRLALPEVPQRGALHRVQRQ